MGSGRPTEALKWWNEVYEATSLGDLDDPSGQFETWDLKIGDGLNDQWGAQKRDRIEGVQAYAGKTTIWRSSHLLAYS